MKTTITLLACLMSTALVAKTTLKIPLYVEEYKDKKSFSVSTAEINKRYKLEGAEKLLEELVVTNDKESLEKAHDTYWTENTRADKISEKYKAAFSLTLSSPSDGLCYMGKADEAVAITGQLADGPFSDQMGFWGWKYKKETHYEDAENNSDTNDFLNKESKIWKNWKGNDESILI
ncbi:MAG: hypothetical protein H7336_11730, partial [Bacteriovorax sp.]|nr:hypothetical protein [Bacteriovorax sp.]